MARVFDRTFDEPVPFTPDLTVISRRGYSREWAAELIADDAGILADEVSLSEAWVRYGPTPEGVDVDFPMCWYTCRENDRGAQPVWIFGDY
jgi:hypothetical protein